MTFSARVENSMVGLAMPSQPPATTTIHIQVIALRTVRVVRSRFGAL
jgi:hypothetical protein